MSIRLRASIWLLLAVIIAVGTWRSFRYSDQIFLRTFPGYCLVAYSLKGGVFLGINENEMLSVLSYRKEPVVGSYEKFSGGWKKIRLTWTRYPRGRVFVYFPLWLALIISFFLVEGPLLIRRHLRREVSVEDAPDLLKHRNEPPG